VVLYLHSPIRLHGVVVSNLPAFRTVRSFEFRYPVELHKQPSLTAFTMTLEVVETLGFLYKDDFKVLLQ